MVDVRKSLRSIELFDDDRARERLDWPDGALVRFRVAVSHEGSARPIEVLSALFGADVAPRAEIARLGLWAPGSVDPLDVDSLRRQPAAAAPVLAADSDSDADAAVAAAGIAP